jgi:hypothetical protein
LKENKEQEQEEAENGAVSGEFLPQICFLRLLIDGVDEAAAAVVSGAAERD